MKHLTHTLKTLLLSLCCLYVLSSCQKDEEIIPLTDADHAGEVTADAFAIEDAVNIVVDENGEITGYLDDNLNFRDINGDHLPSTESISTKTNRVVIYEGTDFTGRQKAVFSSGNIVSYFFASSNFTVRSIAVPPGCTVQLFKNNDLTGSVGTFGWNSDTKADYQKNISALTTEGTKSLKVTCHEGREIYTKNTFCGYSYDEAEFGGTGLPFYKNTEMDFSTLGRQVNSFKSNTASACEGIMFTDTDGIGLTTWVGPDSDMSQNQRFFSDMWGGESGEWKSSFDEVDFPIGAVLYDESDYKGKMYILSANSTKFKFPHYSVLSWKTPFKSAVLPAYSGIHFDGYTDGILNPSSSIVENTMYLANINYSTRGLTLEASTIQRYCGNIIHTSGAVDDEFQKNIPVFQSNDAIDIASQNTGILQSTHFEPTTLTNTTCSGVTIWKENSANHATSLRQWFQAKGATSSSPVEFFVDNGTFGSITTEGCTPESVGYGVDALNALIDASNQLNIAINQYETDANYRMSTASRIGVAMVYTGFQTATYLATAGLFGYSMTEANYFAATTAGIAGTCWIGLSTAKTLLDNQKHYDKKAWVRYGLFTEGNKWIIKNMESYATTGFGYTNKADFEEAWNGQEFSPLTVKAVPIEDFPTEAIFPHHDGTTNQTLEWLWKNRPNFFLTLMEKYGSFGATLPATQVPQYETKFYEWAQANLSARLVYQMFSSVLKYSSYISFSAGSMALSSVTSAFGTTTTDLTVDPTTFEEKRKGGNLRKLSANEF